MPDSKFTSHAKPKVRIAWGRLFLFIIFVGLVVALIANVSRVKTALGIGLDDSYYAVFLTNNEVYFGKITEQTGQRMTLSGVYYLNGAAASGASSTKSSLELIKLGQEVHGPTDSMYIPHTSIIFYEKLRADSAVAKYMREGK